MSRAGSFLLPVIAGIALTIMQGVQGVLGARPADAAPAAPAGPRGRPFARPDGSTLPARLWASGT